MDNIKYVISYQVTGREFDYVCRAESASSALADFWKTFDARDRDKVTNVKIFCLTEIRPAID